MSERLFRSLASCVASASLCASLFIAFAISGCASRPPIASAPPPPPAAEPPPVPAPVPTPTRPPAPPGAAQPPTRPAPFVPGIYVEEGIASWYGAPFHGRRAANGELFDMNSLVAAHRTLPFGSIVRVTNLNNGRDVQVRVIDRGPFVSDRVLDVARAAAVVLGMIGAGTAPVRIELLSGPNLAAGDFTVQVGAFSDRGNAERLRGRLLERYQPIFVQEYGAPSGHFYRVRVGRVSSLEAAQELAAQLRDREGFQAFVIRLDSPDAIGVQ